jgi:hypothetical protein
MGGFSGIRSGGAPAQEKKNAAVKNTGVKKDFMPLLSV